MGAQLQKGARNPNNLALAPALPTKKHFLFSIFCHDLRQPMQTYDTGAASYGCHFLGGNIWKWLIVLYFFSNFIFWRNFRIFFLLNLKILKQNKSLSKLPLDCLTLKTKERGVAEVQHKGPQEFDSPLPPQKKVGCCNLLARVATSSNSTKFRFERWKMDNLCKWFSI